jgi:hypothetical protein
MDIAVLLKSIGILVNKSRDRDGNMQREGA